MGGLSGEMVTALILDDAHHLANERRFHAPLRIVSNLSAPVKAIYRTFIHIFLDFSRPIHHSEGISFSKRLTVK